jgi:hypothetical protein
VPSSISFVIIECLIIEVRVGEFNHESESCNPHLLSSDLSNFYILVKEREDGAGGGNL